MNNAALTGFKFSIHLLALLPLVWLYHGAFFDQLGADPVEKVIHFTGIGAFNILLITLLITPLTRLTKLSILLRVRRLIGLYAFFYALVHILNFLAFEVQFDFSLFISEIVKRPYITIGMTAFLILLLLAFTSPMAIRKRMKERWQKLHNWVYPCALLVGVHFYWSVKSEVIEPSIYIAITFILLVLRKEKIKRIFKRKIR